MTTQELKQQIDKVLGNSIRCLLPSYWWKRLFNQVADRIEDVEQSTSQLIDSKVEEVKMPIVESVDELEKLKLPKCRVAAVEKTGESATVKISDCYFSSNWEEDWSKYTIVKGIEVKDNAIIDNEASVLFSASKEMITKDALQVSKLNSGIFYYIKWADDEPHISSLGEVNKALSSGKYRAIININDPDDYFTFYLEKPQPSLYIKGDSWERLAKEYVVSSEEELNALSVENGTIAKVARELKQINRANCHTVIKFSDIPANWDKFTHVDKVEHIGGDTACGINLAHYDGHNYVVLRINFAGSVTYVASVYVDSTNTNDESITKAKVDVMLKEYDFRYIGPTFMVGEPYIDSTFILYEKDISVDAYIKGETWTRLLKEGDVTGGSHEAVLFYMPMNNGLSEKQKQTNAESYRKVVEGFNNNRYYDVKVDCVYCIADATIVANALLTEGRIALMFDMLNTWQVMEVLEDGSATVEEEVAGKGCEIREFYIGDSLTDEQKAWNLETAQAILDKKAIVICNGSILGDGITTNNDGSKEFINSAPTPQGVLYTGVKVEEDGTASIFFRQLYLDDKLSDKSTNAVQNKVIAEAINTKADKTDIKTINGVSLLGGGNLQLGEGVSEDYVNTAIANAITTTLNTAV